MYEVVSFIGAGTYGYVYKVREPMPLSRLLALKVLRLDQFNEKAQTSFMQEARRIAAMQHPNILPIYNFGRLENDQPYFVMEYAPQTISDIFRTSDGSKRLAFAEELVPYLRQTADALQYVHDMKMVHQDVKPGNLLIGRNGQVLLSDFGTTLYLGTYTHASLGEVTGTAAYMPLEQWQGNPRRDSDQYALAICCYELLTGRTPFTYKRIEEMWNAQINELPPSPQHWNPRIPVEVAAVLLRALSKDYHRRYSSITEFAGRYANAVYTAQQRYVCQHCGQQNRTGAQRCTFCGADKDNRACPYCDTQVRFGQRCCSVCGRLTLPQTIVVHSPLVGVSVRQARYTIKRVLKQSDETRIMTAVAHDTQANERQVVLKRWECADALPRRAKDVAYYEQVTEPLAKLHHPFVPAILDRFAEGKHYYMTLAYIDGESIEERLQKLLRPLAECDVLGYMNSLLNVLLALEQQSIHHYDISPANILIEQKRGRAMLTGFQVPPPPQDPSIRIPVASKRTTRKLAISPYLPIQDKPYDQRTSIYMLAATMHHALTNIAPPHYPTYPPVRMLNPNVSPALEAILGRALFEEAALRYQSYEAMRRDVQKLLV
ncbi:MAG: hypothetical protein NVSMB38_13140 [Ktedonobacteraceae bacterium]